MLVLQINWSILQYNWTIVSSCPYLWAQLFYYHINVLTHLRFVLQKR